MKQGERTAFAGGYGGPTTLARRSFSVGESSLMLLAMTAAVIRFNFIPI
jgi:hypothetical protein